MKKWIDGFGKSLWAWMLLVIMSGCTDNRDVFGEYRPNELIAFTASLKTGVQAVVGRGVASNLGIEEEEWLLEGMESSEESRGAVVSGLNGLNVGVFGYADGTKIANLQNKAFTFIDNEDLLPDADPVPWNSISDKAKLKVFAYAPILESGVTDVNGTPTLSYTVPTDVAAQNDIIASDMKEVAANYNQYIPLTFNHVLTGVRFKLGKGFGTSCKVTSLKVEKVYGQGTYALGGAWSAQNTPTDFTVIDNGNTSYTEGDMLQNDQNILMMIPQLLPNDAQVVLTYDGGTVTAPLKGLKWEPGKLITYTINKESTKPEYIYFDLYAGNVNITPTSYSGWVFVYGVATEVKAENVSNLADLKFYVYQSTASNCANTGWVNEIGTGTCRIPSYAPVKVGDKFWSEFITNNPNVEEVIETWDKKENLDADKTIEEGSIATYDENFAVRKVNRSSTPHYIDIRGIKDGSPIVCNLTIDNLYSRHQVASVGRTTGGLTFCPVIDASKLTVNLVGDNRFGAVHYWSGTSEEKNNQIVFQGSGSLTAAAVDFHKDSSQQSKDNGEGVSGYFPNYWCSAIGGNDGSQGNAIGIVIKGGTIFAGTTLAENCTAIGGGGNDRGVVTIEGGTVTAVASTTGTAIGGGIGFNSYGGIGIVDITGGRVFAYNLGNEWEIPSAAIGSAGSSAKYGGEGTVNISGNAYVYAQTALGTAIGGGSSKTQRGGSATINISGNCYVVAKSIAAIDKNTGKEYPAGNGIGGGTGGTGKASDKEEEKETPAYGGSATISIEGTPTIRTGSIGGGKTNNPEGKIGNATIVVEGGDISAQFVMAGGAGEGAISKFEMAGGTISNSDVHDNDYYHVQKNGGAVYMEDGVFTMSGGTIQNCSAEIGGAVYIKKSANALQDPTFNMSGGTIQDCMSETHGGAVYLEVGEVNLTGNAKIQRNLAQEGNGGAIYITAGDFSMNGNTAVTYNSALGKDNDEVGNGGGIYVTSESTDVNVNVLSGTIQHNTSDGNGGGICVDMTNVYATANITIAESGSTSVINPNIQYNESVMFGGGLYASGSKAKIDINGGIIMNNSVSNYVPNENVSNEGGTVTLNGGEVTHVIVTFDANAPEDDTAKLDGEKTATQKIVTNTNSFLVEPSNKNRNFYIFDSWNTRPDGNGTVYKNGDTMNLKENITLYAQWKHQ